MDDADDGVPIHEEAVMEKRGRLAIVHAGAVARFWKNGAAIFPARGEMTDATILRRPIMAMLVSSRDEGGCDRYDFLSCVGCYRFSVFSVGMQWISDDVLR